MGRANRPLALVLLLMAVLCSPAGVCVIEGVVGTVQAAAPAHAHSCCKNVEGTLLTASDGSCCTEPRTGFVNVFRFMLQKQAPSLALDIAHGCVPRALVTDRMAFDRRAPLVLRI